MRKTIKKTSMKIFKFLAAFVLATSLFSCSSDSSSDSSDSTANFFNLTYNGTAKTVNLSDATSIRQEDFIEVYAEATDGSTISFGFNTHGNLYDGSVRNGMLRESTFAYFSNNTFTFELVELNTTNKTVKVNFTGKVYENAYDHTSAFSTVSGSFKIPYIDYPPTISGVGTHAKLNGVDWYATSNGSTGDGGTSTVTVQNGSEYVIGMVYPYNNPDTGTFNFTDNSAANRIYFAKYDPATHELVEYNVSGTITYTTASTIIQGTFNLTATHPTNGSIITITNGTFKEGAM